MHIKLVLRNFLNANDLDLHLKNDATLLDLYEELAKVAVGNIPASIWNPDKKRFRGPIIVKSGKTVLKDEKTLLYDGQEIEIKRFLIGG